MAVETEELLTEDEEAALLEELAEEIELDPTSKEFVKQIVERTLVFMEYLCDSKLFPYQQELARRIVESLIINDGEEITALFSRQSGKTETVANVVATVMVLFPRLAQMFPDLMGKYRKGVMIGTFAPVEDQAETLYGRIVDRLTSDRAIEVMLDPEIDDAASGGGKIVKLKKSGSFCRMQTANPRAKIESKSYHLIVIDEAQHADEYTVRKSIHPMGAFYNATIVKTGTPDVTKGDFYKAIQRNKRRQTKGRQNHFEFDWRYCNTGEAPIWMGDFSFKPLADVQVGDEVVGWEVYTTPERGRRGRRLTKAYVMEVHRRQAPVIKVTMASGTVIRCTGDHRWLSGKSKGAMAIAEEVQGGVDYFITPDVGRELVRVVHPTGPCPTDERTAGWLAGMWDGEGSGMRIAQSPSFNPVVYKRIAQSLDDMGIQYTERYDGYYMQGGRQTLVDFLNWTDPAKRAGSTASREILRGKFMRETDEIVSIEPDGVDEVISLTTTTGNYVAWGYASKNCAKYNENYKRFVRKEMLRIGEDSDEFQLSFALRWLLERGMFVTESVMEELGDKSMEVVKAYFQSPVVVGIDPARRTDSTVVTVVWVGWDRPDEFGFYDHRILNWLEIQGEDWESQYYQIVEFLSNYDVLAVGVDSQGMGGPVAERLGVLLAPRGVEVVPLTSNTGDQSERWKHLQQLIGRRRLGWPAHAKTRRLRTYKRFHQQMIDLEKKYQGKYLLAEAPDEAEAHDDYPDSLAIACALTKDFEMPEVEISVSPFYR